MTTRARQTMIARQLGSRNRFSGYADISADDALWQDSMKLATKLMAFRESLPTPQQGLLDVIMKRAQYAASAGLTDVAGYDQSAIETTANAITNDENWSDGLEDSPPLSTLRQYLGGLTPTTPTPTIA